MIGHIDLSANHVRQITEYLAQGWMIDQPVFACGAYISSQGLEQALQISLVRQRVRHTISIPDGMAVRKLLDQLCVFCNT